jgi:pimeloyl-ACP methyl ester carboxylesterase
MTGWFVGSLVLAAAAWSAEMPGDSPKAAAATPATPATTNNADWLKILRRSGDSLQWSDDIIRHDWRLQRRPGADAYRILDPQDEVVQEGSRQACLEALATLEQAGKVSAVNGPTVLVLHGLGEGRRSMRPIVEYLRKHTAATVLSFGYASTSAGIDDHGRALAAVIEHLPAADSISFVGHSMGNLVVRRWIDLAEKDDLARVRRMVMLGPPNQGSELARMVATISVLAALSNGAARELVLDWDRISQNLAVPPCPFGIVAGGKGDDRGYSSFLAGDDDAVVRVEETRLAGAADFLLLPVHHAAMMKNPTVQQATATFLNTGRFPPAVPTAAAAAK